MSWRFGDCELDPRAFELRREGTLVPVEPQVFQLLQLLVENRGRMLTKDEIIERIWDGRAISDSALSSRIKSARAAIGDDGKAQRFIRTIHGMGFRFVGEAEETAPAAAATSGEEIPAPSEERGPPDARPSIAVLPFRLIGVAGPWAGIEQALPTDLVTDLSRLRWLFVIARESSFRLGLTGIGEAGRRLGARYALTGAVEIVGDRVAISVELGETAGGGVVWTERFAGSLGDIHDIRRDIGSAILSAVELEIPLLEAQQARLGAPETLDAWSAYHLGLSHLFRGLPAEMAQARRLFERAIALDPGFARAHAGLSSAHFLQAFVHRDREARAAARASGERAVELDPRDPFVNMAQGRTLWLENDLEGSLAWLERATTLNPNFAQAIYSRGWTEALLGDHAKAEERALLSLRLSPLDPLSYAMVGIRSFAAMGRGDEEAAADLAATAARTPGAHALIQMLAVAGCAMAGRDEDARRFALRARELSPEASIATYLRAFPFRDERVRRDNEAMLARYGF